MIKFCVISNGHGEDTIAVSMIRALKKCSVNSEFLVFPLVGEGHSFLKEGFSISYQNLKFPSGGFIRSLRDLYRDIQAGLLGHILRQRKALCGALKETDVTIAVGDVFCLWMAAQTKKKVFFMPTAKSDTFMAHSQLEIWLMKRWSSAVFTRDEITAHSLKQSGVNAFYFGNVMMDNVFTKEPIPNINTQKPIIGILPGSRDEAYVNLGHIVKIMDSLGDKFSYVLAKSPALDDVQIRNLVSDVQVVITEAFNSVISHADLVIGLSGTGNEQAAYLGCPVVCFEGFGPQTTKKRFLEQKNLMGKHIHFVSDNTPSVVADVIRELLDKEPRKKMSMLQDSASIKIASLIVEEARKAL